MLWPESKTALRRLSVFAGGARLRAVQTVVANDRDPLGTVTDLVDASLATIKEQMDGEPRVTLLQTITDFGHDRLDDAGETPATRDRHARHFLTFAETHVPRMFTGQQLRARERLEDERANLLAALEWCLGETALAATSGNRSRIGCWWAPDSRRSCGGSGRGPARHRRGRRGSSERWRCCRRTTRSTTRSTACAGVAAVR